MILSVVGGVAVGAVLDKLSLSGCQGSVFGAVVTMIVLVPDYPEDLCSAGNGDCRELPDFGG